MLCIVSTGLLDVKNLKPETDAYMAFEEKVRTVTSQDPFNSTAFAAGNQTGEVLMSDEISIEMGVDLCQ